MRTIIAALWLASSAAFAQPSLLLPNNSAGSELDTPPVLTQPPVAPRTADTPKRTQQEVTTPEQPVVEPEPIPPKDDADATRPPRDDDDRPQ